MARTVPTTEPASLRAGDTWEWTRDLADFPATTWTLTYTFFNASSLWTVVASADGTTHSVDVAPATTGTRTAGRYDWIARVTDSTDVYTVGKGVAQVLPSLAALSEYDGRSHARKMLDLLNAALESRATAGQIEMVRVDLTGRGLQYSIENLITLREKYAAAVRAEDDALALANGKGSGRIMQVRFR